jgi:hypothetical protein
VSALLHSAATIARSAERLLLVLLALFGVAAAWSASRPARGIDFYQFWAVGQALAGSGAEDVYTDAGRRRVGADLLEAARGAGQPRRLAAAEYRAVLETYSTPFLYATFGALSTGDYEADFRTYRRLTLACLVVSVVLLCAVAGGSLDLALLSVLAFSVWFEPFASDLRVGNVNSLQLLMLAVYLATAARGRRPRARQVAGGAILGLAVMFKPNLAFVVALLLAWWIVSAQPRVLAAHVAGGGVGALAAFALSSASFGSPRIWWDWLAALRSLPDRLIATELGNVAPARLIGEALGIDAALPLAILFAAIALAAIWGARSAAPAGARCPSPEAVVVALGCLLMLIASRLAWLHYFVSAIPMLVVLLRPLGERAGPMDLAARRLLPVLAFAMLAGTPLRLAGGDPGPPLLAGASGAAALLLFGAGVRELAKLASPNGASSRNG